MSLAANSAHPFAGRTGERVARAGGRGRRATGLCSNRRTILRVLGMARAKDGFIFMPDPCICGSLRP